jgi:hypothetical protein
MFVFCIFFLENYPKAFNETFHGLKNSYEVFQEYFEGFWWYFGGILKDFH